MNDTGLHETTSSAITMATITRAREEGVVRVGETMTAHMTSTIGTMVEGMGMIMSPREKTGAKLAEMGSTEEAGNILKGITKVAVAAATVRTAAPTSNPLHLPYSVKLPRHHQNVPS